MESIHKIWATTSGENVEFTLLVKDNKFYIYRDGQPFLIYVDDLKKWVGATPTGIIMLEWLTLRDICEIAEYRRNNPTGN